MELVERAYGVSVFRAHATACTDGELPEFDLSAARRGTPAVGKAVLFARRDVVVGDTQAWLRAQADPPAIRDIPRPGERILAGRPVCTVIASGKDHTSCHTALVRLADQVFGQLSVWEREIA
jgi:predicted ATP-grasp superfamily ATP-dependent carboligase